MNHELFVCVCGNLNHELIVTSFNHDENDEFSLAVTVRLNSNPSFWSRLRDAIRYACGTLTPADSLADIYLNKEQVKQLITVLRAHQKTMK